MPVSADRELAAALERHRKGDLESACRVYRRVLEQSPDHPAALHYLGLIAQQTGNPRRAAKLLRKSIRLNPTDPRAHNHLGQVYLTQNRQDEAGRCFEKAVEVDPTHLDSLNSLANVTKARGDLSGAIALYRRILTLNPRAPHAAYNLANALKQTQAYDEALEWFERAIQIEPKDHRAHHNLAVLLEQKGRFDAAAKHYEQALRINPGYAKALSNLIAMATYEPDEETVDRAEAMLGERDVDEKDLIRLRHGLGRHYERRGRYDDSFRHFAAANALLKRRNRAFDPGAVVDYFDRLIATFSAAHFATADQRGCTTERPIFIVGMPRSGTTLTEQILASHPSVYGAGEMQEIPRLVKSLGPRYPEVVAEMDAPAIVNLGTRYVEAVRGRAPDGAARVTDKLPLNFVHLGLIATLFPEARIVHCRRDPLDVGLSCFMQRFNLELDFTTDLGHFGQYFLQYERLMAHWRKVLPLTIYEQCYENLIADPEMQSKALIAHCGLDWNEACLDFRSANRAVLTPSRWQVRQPIYTSSIGRWKRFASHMAPLQRVLLEGHRSD